MSDEHYDRKGFKWYRSKRRKTDFDIICDNCEQWCNPIGHNKRGDVFCWWCATMEGTHSISWINEKEGLLII